MKNIILEKSYTLPPVDVAEVYRYAGVGEVTPEVSELLSECLGQCAGKFSGKVCYGVYDIKVGGDAVDFGFTKVASDTLVRNLTGCHKAVIFTATVGIEIDRLITRYSANSPSKAVMLQAIGTERIESLCDTFNDEIKREYNTVPRVSPGYGDIPMDMQGDIFNLLSPYKRIGLTLNESLMMSPTKSVSAIIGLK